MEMNVSPASLGQSLSSDNRTSAFPVPKEPPLVQLQEPFVVSSLFSQLFNKKYSTTRLHSSRMHTTRSLTVSPSMHCSQGGVCSWGGAWSGGSVPRGLCSWGNGIPACTEADPPVDRMTDTCKNITFINFVCWW